MLPGRWRYAAAAAAIGVLAYAGFVPEVDDAGLAAIWSATIAHLIAFPLGWIAYYAWRRSRAGTGPLSCPARVSSRAGAGDDDTVVIAATFNHVPAAARRRRRGSRR